MAISNPIFRSFGSPKGFRGGKSSSSAHMSLKGTLRNTALLLVLFAVAAGLSWNEVGLLQRVGKNAVLIPVVLFIACALGGIALIWVTVSKKDWSPVTAPLYALVQGFVVGIISVGMDRRFPGIAIQAAGLTTLIGLGLVGGYRLGIIRVTESFNRKLAVATSGVIVYYVATFIFALVYGHALTKILGGIPGILVSVAIVIVAAMSLISNFDFAVQASKENFPRYMEWYAALGLVVTLIWLYLEILDLLSKERRAQMQ